MTPVDACRGPGAVRPLIVRLCVVLAAALPLAACSGSGGRPSPSSPAVPKSYGALPTFLPTDTSHPDAQLTGRPGRPAVTSQGDDVLAHVSSGTVEVRVTGPIVPGEGLPYVTSSTTCTWTVTFTHPTVPVPIRTADFVSVDEDGNTYHPRFVAHQARPPSVLSPGRSTSFPLRVVMATGEGVMRWQPAGDVLAVWDFVVEND